MAERVEGGTRFTREDAHRLRIWLEDYSLGQSWGNNELRGSKLFFRLVQPAAATDPIANSYVAKPPKLLRSES